MGESDLKKLSRTIIEFINSQQQVDGNFCSLSSDDRRDFTGPKRYRTTFFSSLIISCLAEIENGGSIKKKAADFLMSQKSANWTFNYWDRNSKEYALMAYPDDLDDTFCALAALYRYEKELFDGEVMANMTKVLVAVEQKEGGPYKTWLVGENFDEAWKDIDLAVNANIAFFLSLLKIKLPSLVSLAEKAIENGDYSSPYYPTAYPAVYFISRFYKGKKKRKAISYLWSIQEEDLSWGNSLNSALAISALLNFGDRTVRLEKSLDALAANIAGGSFRAEAFCIDPVIGGKTFYAGSPALTAAFCLEALAKYEKYRKTDVSIGSKHRHSGDEKKISDAIRLRMQERINLSGGDLARIGLKALEKTLGKDVKGEISLLAFFYKEALGGKGRILDNELMIRLGMANCYGWMAYTIYDDFLDDEGDTKLLSFANLALRELTSIFSGTFCSNKAILELYRGIMDTVDASNTWEAMNCRMEKCGKSHLLPEIVPDYGDLSPLYERSFGHSLGPLAATVMLGHGVESKEYGAIHDFFKHYLLARQLNDDMHDWEKDLKNGQINCVGASLLKKIIGSAGNFEDVNFPNGQILKKMQKIFWKEQVFDYCDRISASIKTAGTSLEKSCIIVNPELISVFLEPLGQAAEEARIEGKNALKFIKNFR